MANQPEHRRCPNCQLVADKTSWLPEPGLDPAMRYYHCPYCDHLWFIIPKTAGAVPTQTELLIE